MSKKFIRIYKDVDINEIKRHLMIYGDLSGNCANCQTLDLKIDTLKCPKCQSEFKYLAFRNVRNHMPKMTKLTETRPDLTFVDYDDFKRLKSALKAEEFFK